MLEVPPWIFRVGETPTPLCGGSCPHSFFLFVLLSRLFFARSAVLFSFPREGRGTRAEETK